jgi:hypothetical protein
MGPSGRPLSGPVESFDRLTFDDPNNPNLSTTGPHPAEAARQVVNSRSEFIAMTAALTAALPAAAIPTAPTQLAGGGDGTGTPGSQDFIGSPPGLPQGADPTLSGSGLHALDKIDDVSLIAIPGVGDAATISAAMEYCKISRPLSDCFFIGDVGALAAGADPRTSGTAPDVDTPQQAHDFPATLPDRSVGDYGAIYYPWVWAADPIGRGSNPRILLPPSGFVAGLYARIDNTRGVFKAPAGTEAGLAGVLAPSRVIDDIEQDSLNPVSVNVIRPVPAGGIVVWGARTIGTDPGWRYIPVRRMAIFLRVSIYRGIQWAVFEPNDEPLWSSLRLNIRAFMLTQFRAGAFQGAKPDDAFFVLCDSTTTTQTDIDNGVVNILVGFAPLKPAEFVVLKLSQKVNQPASQ